MKLNAIRSSIKGKMKSVALWAMGLIILAACTTKKESSSLTETDIRGSWEQLTYKDGKWVIFKPCNANNCNITWKGDTLFIEWGQESTAHKIKKISSESNNFTLEGVEVFLTGDHSTGTLRVAPVDSMKGVTSWWLFGEEEPRIFVRDKLRDSYPVIMEQCEEEDRD